MNNTKPCWPHLWGEELYNSNGFFVQTILADPYNRRREMWVVSLKSSSSAEFETKKIFLKFVFFFEELSRIEVFCEHLIFDMILFIFSVIFQFKIFIIKNIDSKLHFTPQNQLWVPNRRKAIKRLVLVS